MKRIRKLLGMAVTFAFALAILPATALAVDEYDLHVNGEQFTSEIFRSIIQEQFPEAKCYISEINTNPIIYL